MKNLFSIWVAIILAICFVGNADAQRISQLSPPNINLWGVSTADFSHVMLVGDSASILLCNTPSLVPQYYHHLSSPCDKSHTFYGVSYYDTLHAAIVADNGLIFTTSDAGNSWDTSGAGMTGQTLRAITHITKGGSAGSLIVAGDSGIILRSTDQGANWSRVTSNTTHNINAIAINTNGTGFIVGEHGLIGRTTNFGVSWPFVTDTLRNVNGNTDFMNFRAVSTDNSVWGAALAVGDSGAIAWESGNRWTAFKDTIFAPVSAEAIQHCNYRALSYWGSAYEIWDIYGDGDFGIQMAIASSGGPNQIYNFAASAIGDADGGTDYLPLRVTCAENWFGKPGNLSIAVSPGECIQTNNESGIVSPEFLDSYQNFLFLSLDSLGNGFALCTGGYFLRTTDNGFSWAWVFPLPDTTVHYIAADIYTLDSNSAFAIGWSGSLFRTTDGGAHWDSTNIAAANQLRLRGIAHPGGSVFLASGDYGKIVRSTDNGSTWNACNVPSSITNYLETITFSTSEIGIAAGDSGTIVRTTDQGLTWSNVNNQLTGTDYAFRRLQGFPSGTYYASTDSAGLWRSTDQGQNWISIPNAPQILGMGFYNERTGVIGESTWSSQTVPDTMRFAFTRDGFATKTVFNVPFINNDRVSFHFIDSNTFLCFGSNSFVVKVDMSQGSARVTDLSSQQISTIEVFPNPSVSHSTMIEYDLANSGATTIELWNMLGEKVQSLFSGSEDIGHHSRSIQINPELHGSFFVKVISGTEVRTIPISVE